MSYHNMEERASLPYESKKDSGGGGLKLSGYSMRLWKTKVWLTTAY